MIVDLFSQRNVFFSFLKEHSLPQKRGVYFLNHMTLTFPPYSFVFE